MDRMQTLSASIDRLDLFSQEHDDLASTLLADAVALSLDGDGRILLPDNLKRHAHLHDTAAFVGRGATFQIWSPEAFSDHQHQAQERLRAQGASLKLERAHG